MNKHMCLSMYSWLESASQYLTSNCSDYISTLLIIIETMMLALNKTCCHVLVYICKYKNKIKWACLVFDCSRIDDKKGIPTMGFTCGI